MHICPSCNQATSVFIRVNPTGIVGVYLCDSCTKKDYPEAWEQFCKDTQDIVVAISDMVNK
jgi:protein-arginine kinase activator protein McsA